MRFFGAKLPPHVKLTMPSLSPTMEKGNLSKWNKKVGDEVGPGDILAEVETDKATVDFEMQEEGYVARLMVDEGAQDIALGQIVAILVENEEDIDAFKDWVPEASDKKSEKAKITDHKSDRVQDDKEVAEEHTQEPRQSSRSKDSGDRVNASPYARKLAKDRGIDINKIEGTGPHGRIIATDVEKYKEPKASSKQTSTISEPVSTNYKDLPLSQMRKVIAQRLSLSKDTIPHYYVTVECEVDKLLVLRAKLNEHSTSKISVNDMVIKAASLASMKVP